MRLAIFACCAAFILFWSTLLAAEVQAAPSRAATMTFLVAECPAESSMHSRVSAGQDPRAADNGSGTAVPADIGAYGCSQVPASYHLFLLGGSTAGSVFRDETLSEPAAISSSSNAHDGSATLLANGGTFFIDGNKEGARRVAVSEFPVNVSSRAPLPVLDLQCHNDGVNNDNADGFGWNKSSLSPGEQVFCILYVAGKDAEVTPTRNPSASATVTATATRATPTATSSPDSSRTVTATRTTDELEQRKLIIHKRTWEPGSQKWQPATPAHSWTFQVFDNSGTVVAEPADGDNTPLAAGSYKVIEKADQPAHPAFKLVDFFKSAGGGSACPDEPAGGSQSVALTPNDFAEKGDGTIHLCAYNKVDGSGPEAATPGPSGHRADPPEKYRSVRPFVECVIDHGGGTFTAYFGYENGNKGAVTIEPGERNRLNPGVPGVTPPSRFEPGRSPAFPDSAFAVEFDGKALEWTLAGPNSKPISATADASSKACARPKLIKEFVSEDSGVVTWRLRPSFDMDMLVWDWDAETCKGFGGAACGGVTSGDYGKFYSTGSGQYMEVTQRYTVEDGKKCMVTNTAAFATAPFTSPPQPGEKVTATYKCSGATAMGWPLLGVAFAGAVAAAWAINRKRA